jgi:pimeloyl-ACP methyl ester carboxylesterase
MRPDAMPAPAELAPYARELELGHLRLHYYDAGAGEPPPLVLLHGLGDEADTWRRVIGPLAERRRVIAPDLPGFGRSSAAAGAHSIAFFAGAVAALLARLGVTRAALVGSSMGAVVAQRLALGRPALVERLVLVGGGLPARSLAGESAGEPGARPSLRTLLFLVPGLGELVYTSLRRSQDKVFEGLRPYYYDFDGLPDEQRAFLRQRVWARVWSARQRRAFLSALRWAAVEQLARAAAYGALAERVGAPIRLVWGEHDRVVPPAYGRGLAEALGGAPLHIIPRCGHLPQQERPTELIEALSA